MEHYDYLIVGCGLYGATFAHQCKLHGKTCLVIDKRAHIGGNTYCKDINGVNVHMYGPHIFHTSNKKVWDYVNSLCEFNHFRYEPLADYNGERFNLPFNMATFSRLWDVKTPQEAKSTIEADKPVYEVVNNLEEQAISMVGKTIYQKLIKGYTEKQWGRNCRDLPKEIIKRIPLRFTYSNNYYNDKYQGIPIGGYNVLIQKMLEDVEVQLCVDYLKNREMSNFADTIIFTGPIDEYFDYCYGHLEYRSLRFENEVIEDNPNYQGVAGINYTDETVPYTRIIEHKHFQCLTDEEINRIKDTVITREYPVEWNEGMEPYYPINDVKNTSLYKSYKELADATEPSVIFAGRLGEYKYYDMDDTVENVLNFWER